MKKHCKKYLLGLICLLLLIPCLTLGVLADVSDADALEPDAENPYLDSDGYVIWSYNSDTDTVRGLGKEYTRYVPSMNIYLDGDVFYFFENEIYYPGEGYVGLIASNSAPEIIEINSYYTLAVYVTDKGRVSLDALQNGEAASYRIETPYGYSATLDAAFAKELKNGTEKREFDVTTLRNALQFDVLGYDGTGAYACVYGAVYSVDGGYYYVHYMTLGNQHFDANGDFSYRSGTVEAIKLSDEQARTLLAAERNAEFRMVEYQYEYEDISDHEVNEDGAIIMFVICMVILGFVVPLPLLIVSICMARSHKRRYPKYWYILTAVSAAWMVMALILLIVLL